MDQREVFIFQMLDVPHHLRFRTVSIEYRMMQIV